MNTTATPRRTVRTVATTLAGWLLILTGAGHTALVVVGNLAEPTADESRVRETMAETSLVIGGVERSYWDLFQGFSLMMALMLVGLGAVLLLVVRRAPHLITESHALLLVGAAVLLPALLISVLLLPPPPIVLIGIATVSMLIALSRPRGIHLH